MLEWWHGLTTLNQVFYVGALLFSMLFLWQLIAALIGLAGEHDIGTGHEGFDGAAVHEQFPPDDSPAVDAHESLTAFKLVSFRSLMAFFTLFCWAGGLYLDSGASTTAAILLGLLWGLGGMFLVALIFHLMRRMTETGTRRLGSCIGCVGTVYLQIPPGGEGEVRIPVSGVMSVVKARCAGAGSLLKPGTPVKVVRTLSNNSVEVAPEAAPEGASGGPALAK